MQTAGIQPAGSCAGENLPRPGVITGRFIQQESTFWRRRYGKSAAGGSTRRSRSRATSSCGRSSTSTPTSTASPRRSAGSACTATRKPGTAWRRIFKNRWTYSRGRAAAWRDSRQGPRRRLPNRSPQRIFRVTDPIKTVAFRGDSGWTINEMVIVSGRHQLSVSIDPATFTSRLATDDELKLPCRGSPSSRRASTRASTWSRRSAPSSTRGTPISSTSSATAAARTAASTSSGSTPTGSRGGAAKKTAGRATRSTRVSAAPTGDLTRTSTATTTTCPAHSSASARGVRRQAAVHRRLVAISRARRRLPPVPGADALRAERLADQESDPAAVVVLVGGDVEASSARSARTCITASTTSTGCGCASRATSARTSCISAWRSSACTARARR